MNDEAARLAAAWKQALADWAIPAAILDAAPESPYGFPSELFVRRAEAAYDRVGDPTPTIERGLEALGSEGGTVLDVGAGGGATSLPLAARCTGLIAVDGQPDMLDAVDRRAAELGHPDHDRRRPLARHRAPDSARRRRGLRTRGVQRARSGRSS